MSLKCCVKYCTQPPSTNNTATLLLLSPYCYATSQGREDIVGNEHHATGCSLSVVVCLFGSLVPHQHQGATLNKRNQCRSYMAKMINCRSRDTKHIPFLTLKPEARWKGICKFVLIFSLYTSLYNYNRAAYCQPASHVWLHCWVSLELHN